MIEFRDDTAKENGIEMLVYTNEEGVKQGINPFDHGSAYTDIMKTQALKQALDKYGFTAAFGGGRRDEEKSRAKERIFSFRNKARHGILRTSARRCGNFTTQKSKRAKGGASFPNFQLDRKGHLAVHKERKYRFVQLYFAKERPVVYSDGNIIMVDDDRIQLRRVRKPR